MQPAQTVEPPDAHDAATDDTPTPHPLLPADDHGAAERPVATRADNRSVALRAAWIVSALVLAGSAAAVVAMRAQVTSVWPASAWLLGAVERVTPPPSAPAHVNPDPPHGSGKPEKAD